VPWRRATIEQVSASRNASPTELDHGKAVLEAALGKVVEEHATDAALLAPVLEEEVLVAPGLESGVFVRAERRQRVPAHGVEMHRVFLEAVVGREVHAPTEPAHRRLPAGGGRDHAHVHVHRGHVGVARVEHQRHAHGLEGCARELRAVLRGRRRQSGAAHMREPATGALEHRPALQDAGDAVALQRLARGLGPGILHKWRAVDGLDGGGDAGLQVLQVGPYRISLCGHSLRPIALMARYPMSRRYCMPSK
jgi:hypothetical protein